MGRRAGSAGRWALGRMVRAIVDALTDAPPHVLSATLAAATGAPVRSSDAAGQLVALSLVRAGLQAVRSHASPARALDALLIRLEDANEAFERLEADAAMVAYVTHPRRAAYRITAYLWLRARRGRVPTERYVTATVRALREAEGRAKGARKPRH